MSPSARGINSSLPTASDPKRFPGFLDAVRSGDLTEDLALEHHERLTELKMRLLGDRVSRRTAWKIAREQGWKTIYDAEYLAVTRLQADALVTVDAAMATRAEGLVPLAPLETLTAGAH